VRIREIRGYHVEAELPEPLRNAITVFKSRSALVVELVGDGGLSGWGETQNPAAAWAVIESVLAPCLLGKDPLRSGAIWRDLVGERSRGDFAMLGVSALDMAVWDLKGRALGEPIANLLGGRLRDRVTAYASGPFMKPGAKPYRDFGHETDGLLKAGFRALKARCGVTPSQDAEAMLALRGKVGPDFPLMADCNRGYALPAALEAASLLGDARLLWLEEPIAMDNLAGYRSLRARSAIPLAGGEGFSSLGEFRPLLAEGALDLVQPDLYLCGGFTGAQRIAALAEAFETPYLPHVWGTFINFHASLQFAAVLKAWRVKDGVDFPLFEYEQGRNPLIGLQGEPRLNGDGTLSIPDGPGIGIDVRAESFAPYIRKSFRVAL
jgi:D-galactarolactone cycloisomerase